MSKALGVDGIYFVAINIIAFLCFGIDKWKAQNHRWRISEKMLLGLACVGGSIGAWLGMQIFHHKTRKNQFRIGVPVIICLQVILCIIYNIR